MAQTYNIDTDDIKGMVHGLRINSASSPSTTDVENNIEYVSAQIQQEALAVGIDVTGLTDGDADYETFKRAVISKVCGELLNARNRGDDSGAYFINQYDEVIESLRKRPDRLTVNDTGPDLATFVETAVDASTGGSVPGVEPIAWFGTVPGKIIRGNSL
tara:strand:+ start:1431 stop:1907 length:477 start_codon:yes stop_codon:yes gene_type:complete